MPDYAVRIDFALTDEQTSIREGSPDTTGHGKGQNKQIPNANRSKQVWFRENQNNAQRDHKTFGCRVQDYAKSTTERITVITRGDLIELLVPPVDRFHRQHFNRNLGRVLE